jgi:uracil-DNA glycosylase
MHSDQTDTAIEVSPESSAIAVLRWWRDAGVTEIASDQPTSWLAPAHILAPQSTRQAVADASPVMEAPDENVAETLEPAQESITVQIKPLFSDQALSTVPDFSNIADLQALRMFAGTDESCHLRRTATKLVFGDGNPMASMMVIGDAPGTEDDRSGVPFTGENGRMLDQMLSAIGISRTGDAAVSAYLTNAVLWRPPGNREPTKEEMLACLPILRRHIQLVNPKVILALGAIPFQILVNANEGIARARGQWRTITIGDCSYPLLPTLKPDYLRLQPKQKANSWQDLLALKKLLV